MSVKDCLELMRRCEAVEATMKKLEDSSDAHVDASYTRDPPKSHKGMGPRKSSLSLSQMARSQMERSPVSGARKTFIPATSAQPRMQHVNSAARRDTLNGHASRKKGHAKTRSLNTDML